MLRTTARFKARMVTFQLGLAFVILRLAVKHQSLIHNLRSLEELDSAALRLPLQQQQKVPARFATQLTGSRGSSNNNNNNNSTMVITTGKNGECTCDLLSTINCLDSIKCLPSEPESQQLVALGVATRRLLKQMTTFAGRTHAFGTEPIGKGFQYYAIYGYKSWKHRLQLPEGMSHEKRSIFVNSSWYPYCSERNLVSKACFLGDLQADEDLDEMEIKAMASANNDIPADFEDLIRRDLWEFHNRTNTPGADPLPALGYLLVFAHIIRIHFHRNPPVFDVYRERLKTIQNVVVPSNENPLKVSVHMRRADSCNHQRDGYEFMASELDSPAQVTGKRKCYGTSVYLNALMREQQLSQNRTIEVYLSTDDAGSVIEELEEKFCDIFFQMNWHYLDYSRETFQYSGMVEGNAIRGSQQAMLGESAIADLWHMSFGKDVFIGHLGSRFGKISWMLATARRNAFVPFFTVDGHGFCCQIDENCASMKPYITNMDNCMAFASELAGVRVNKDYWEVGSLSRKIEWEMKQKREKRKKM